MTAAIALDNPAQSLLLLGVRVLLVSMSGDPAAGTVQSLSQHAEQTAGQSHNSVLSDALRSGTIAECRLPEFTVVARLTHGGAPPAPAAFVQQPQPAVQPPMVNASAIRATREKRRLEERDRRYLKSNA